MKTATNIVSVTRIARRRAFNVSSKHSTVVKTELLFRSTRTFQWSRAVSANVSHAGSRRYIAPGGRRCLARGSIGAREDCSTNHGGRNRRVNRTRTQSAARLDRNERQCRNSSLDRPEPNLEETRSAFKRVVSEGHRAAQIIAGVRAMFRKDSSETSPVTINELVCDVVSTSLGELKSRRVSLALAVC